MSGKLEHWVNRGRRLFTGFFPPGGTQEWNRMCDANRK
jgi:hypothetical protein